MDKKMLRKFFPVILLIFAMAVGFTGATVLHSLTLENPIKTPTTDGGITEELNNNAKKVSFTNNGEADVFLRVACTETWILESNGEGEDIILPNQAIAEDGQSVSVAKPVWQGITDGSWTLGSDGWYYYNKILPGSKSGERNRNTGFLVNDVNFNLGVIEDERYQKAKYQLHFTMEVVQASDDTEVSEAAVEKLFNKVLDLSGAWGEKGKYGYSISWPQAE